VKPDLLVHIEKIKYSDQDVTDTDKFPKFTKRVYLQTVGVNVIGEPIEQPLQWAIGLEKIGILDLLDLLYFGRGQYTNGCVKQLMAVTHDGDIWLDKLVSIDIELIAHIIGLSSRGMDPMQFLDNKKKEKALVEDMKKKYCTDRGMRGIVIKRINDVTTQMAAKILACKMLRKCHREEVSTGVVIVATQCVEGTTVSWAPYLLNFFLYGCKDAKDLGTKFHYSWMLILIAIMGWKEPSYTDFGTRPTPNCGAMYLSLGTTPDSKHKKIKAAIFE
jgi:hypothetical protein